MINFSVLATTFILVLIAELGDKTQLVAFSLTASTERPKTIFAASSIALVASTIIAGVLGKVANEFIPAFTGYISAGLFIFFGVYMLVRRDISKVEEAFLAAITMERSCIRMIEKGFKCADCYEPRIMNIQRQEHSHTGMFRILIKEKRIFRDAVNDESVIDPILAKLSPCSRRPKRMSFSDVLRELIEKEEIAVAFFSHLLENVRFEHPHGEEIREMIRNMIAEEKEHLEIYECLIEEACNR
jgi:Ca2+/H+ antiporter, TMEM165/GDT1 family